MNTLIRPALEDTLAASGTPFRRDVSLRTCGTWRIGGPADFLVDPASWEQTAAALRLAREHGVPALVIGKGSNLLFDDVGRRGLVIRIGRPLSRITITGTTVHVESGVSASRLAHTVARAGLAGLEHSVGIPGTLGGLIFMNGGSLQRSIGESITQVEAMDRRGTAHVFSRDDCGFAYRTSRFQGEDYIVTAATLTLAPGPREAILAEMRAILRDRRRKFPLTQPSCGSVFKNDPGAYGRFGPPGRILEDTGLKGVTIGDATVSERHANFIVNRGRATAGDVLRLIELIRRQVARRTGLTLACEVRFVPSTGAVRPI